MNEILFLGGSFTEFKGGEDCKRGGDLGLVIALKFGYAINWGAIKHNTQYSLIPDGKMATFFDYASATIVFFNNLDRNWPAEMTVLLVMILLLMFLVKYIIKEL
jgi:hypothetical protein